MNPTRPGNPTRSAFLIIDMEEGFLRPESPHCIPTAAATVPAIARAADLARSKGIPVFFVKRIYRGTAPMWSSPGTPAGGRGAGL